MINGKEQRPTPPNEWLYKDKESVREFYKVAWLPDGTAPWPECTDDEKTAWERANRPQEPERDAAPNQIEDVEVVQ